MKYEGDHKMSKRKFVKYRNRKLHEIGKASSYITMEGLLEVVAGGEEIEVVDDDTGADLTAFTMARLVYERSRSEMTAYAVKDLRKLIMTSPPPKKKAV